MKEYELMQVNFTSKIANSLQKLQSVTKLLLSAVLCGGGCLLAGVGWWNLPTYIEEWLGYFLGQILIKIEHNWNGSQNLSKHGILHPRLQLDTREYLKSAKLFDLFEIEFEICQ